MECVARSRGGAGGRTTGTARERRYKDSSADNSGGMKSIGLRHGQLCCCCSTALRDGEGRKGGGAGERSAPGGPRGSMFNWHTIVGFGVGSVGCAQWGGCAGPRERERRGGGGGGAGLPRCCSSRCALAGPAAACGAAPN